MYSYQFSKYYDQLMGDYSSIVSTTLQLVHTYVPPKSQLLEIGCGTGNILKVFEKEYLISGLDNSSGMLTIAKDKVPNATLFEADMTSFALHQKFDAILCVFDTINHLTTMGQWKKMFRRVHTHLVEGGIFIFDMNTIRRLERLSTADPYVKKFNNDMLMCMQLKKENKVYRGYFQIFENINTSKIHYTEELVDENTFEVDSIKEILEKNFTILKMVDPIRKKITRNTGRIFFVCKKK